jgi:hypothetical protein
METTPMVDLFWYIVELLPFGMSSVPGTTGASWYDGQASSGSKYCASQYMIKRGRLPVVESF